MLPTTIAAPALGVSTPMEDTTATEEILSYDLTEETFTPHDVVLGKGNGINCLPGNVKFRQIIAKYKPLYNSTPRSLKGGVAELVINEVACMDPPGRFLEATADKRFKQVARKRAIEKTCQALREKKTGSKLQTTTATANDVGGRGKASPTNSIVTSATNGSPTANSASNRRRSPPPPPPPHSSSSPVVPASVPAVVVAPSSRLIVQQQQHAPHPSLPPPPPSLTASTTPSSQHHPTTISQLRGGALEETSSTPMQQLQQDVSNTNSEAATDTETKQQPVWPIRENDVLYGGRGRKHFHRLANQRFLELVKYRRNDYHESTSKKNVALCILQEWKNQTPPGRFLQQDAKSEEWFEISTAKIQEKTCQALRDLKRERGPGGVRPLTIADRMVDPNNNNNRNHQLHHGVIVSSNCSNSSGDESNNTKSNNSLQDHVQHSEQHHHALQESHVHEQPPLQQQHQQRDRPPVHHSHQHQQPQHQHSAQLPYQQQQQLQYQQQFAPQTPQGPPPHYPQHAQQPIYCHPPPPPQQQHQHHHALPPMQDQQVSPLSHHDHVYPSHPPMPAQGAPLPPSPQGPTSPPHQHLSMKHHHHFSPVHTPPGQNGWFQDRNSPVYSLHTAPHNSSGMMHEHYAPPPMGHVHHHHPHHSQYPHSMAPAPSAPSTYHLAARPSPPPPPPLPAHYHRNNSYSHGADSTPVPPLPPLPSKIDQDPHATAIHRQAHIVAQEMRKMDEMMRQAGPGCGPLPPPPPPAHHSQPVPRTVVAPLSPLSPPLPPSSHHGQAPIWHGQDQAEMIRHAPGGMPMPESRYGEVAVPPTPHYHYSPLASTASHGSSGSYQQQLSPVTHSIISTSSAADGSSSISISSSSGDLSHGTPGPLLPTKEKETMMMRQVTMNSTTFAPIQNEDDGSNSGCRAVDGAAVQQAQVNALARVAVQNVPVSPPRRQRNDVHNKMMIPRTKKVDTTSPLRKASNVSCPTVQTKNSLPQKTRATKMTKANSSSKNKASCPSSPTKPSTTNKCGKESPLQGELEAASLLANMFAV